MRPLVCAVAVTLTLGIVFSCRTPQQPQIAPEPASSVKKAADTSTCDPSIPPPGAMFPSGFDYPQKEPTVQSWVKDRDGWRERLHAYCLFAGLNYPWVQSTPTWRTWQTTTQAFPYQYNPWLATNPTQAPTGTPAERSVPINVARSRAIGAAGKIVNPAPSTTSTRRSRAIRST